MNVSLYRELKETLACFRLLIVTVFLIDAHHNMIVVYKCSCAIPPHTYTMLDIREQLKSIERGVTQKEPRFINRAVRSLQSLRKKANDNVLRKLLMTYYPPSKRAQHCSIPYSQKFWQGIKFGGLVVYIATAKLKFTKTSYSHIYIW